MANDWGQGVLNTVGWGLDGTMNGQEVTNLLTEANAFLITEDRFLLVEEQTVFNGGFGAINDYSWSGDTLLER